MKAKRISLISIIIASSICFGCKDNATSKIIESTKTSISKSLHQQLEVNAASTNETNPNYVFQKSLLQYKAQFKNYINVVSMNVDDKSEIELTDFDASYVPPKYYDVMYARQKNLTNSFSSSDAAKYETFRQEDYSIDRYASLIERKFTNLNVSLKYKHAIKPIEPINPRTPLNPDYKTTIIQTANVDSSGIVTILTSAGLAEAAITAFTASISAMTSAISTSWIPVIGWSLAAAIITGALIALTVVIVENWDAIQNSLSKIRSWFLQQFSDFASQFNSFFSDVLSKGTSSKKVGEDRVGEDRIPWYECDVKAEAIAISVADNEDKEKVTIVKNVKKQFFPNEGLHYSGFWISTFKVDYEYVIKNQIYDKGISTHTWTYGRALNMVMNGGSSKIKNDKINYGPLYHSFLGTEHRNMNGWDHFHIGERNAETGKLQELNNGLDKKAHSFFGPMYLRKAPGVDELDEYPSNKK